VGEFKSGLYYLAKKRPDIELLPVHIDNLNRVLPRGEFLPVPLLSCISFGPPLWLERGEAKVDFLERARRAVDEFHATHPTAAEAVFVTAESFEAGVPELAQADDERA
jgi:hypothetical protein